jgi:hypothetical protein
MRHAENEGSVKRPLVVRQVPILLAGRWYDPVCECDPVDMVYASADGHVLLVEVKRRADKLTSSQALHRASCCGSWSLEKMGRVRGMVPRGREALAKCIAGGRHNPTTTVRNLLERSAVGFAYLVDGDAPVATLPYQRSPLAAIGMRCSLKMDAVILDTVCNLSLRDGYQLSEIQPELDRANGEYEEAKGKRTSAVRVGNKHEAIQFYDSLPADHPVGCFWRAIQSELGSEALRCRAGRAEKSGTRTLSIAYREELHRLVILYADAQEIWWNTGAMIDWMQKDWGVQERETERFIRTTEERLPSAAVNSLACVTKLCLKKVTPADRRKVASELARVLARHVKDQQPTPKA